MVLLKVEEALRTCQVFLYWEELFVVLQKTDETPKYLGNTGICPGGSIISPAG